MTIAGIGVRTVQRADNSTRHREAIPVRIPEGEHRLSGVQAARVAERHTNPNYLRKKLGVVRRQFDVPLASAGLGVRGSVDEVLTLADGSMAPFDYKFAEAPRAVYHNQKMQSALYGLLIREAFGAPVRRGYLCFVRSKHRIIELEHTEADYAEVRRVLAEILEVIRTGVFPPATTWKARCRDCCYRNICMQ